MNGDEPVETDQPCPICGHAMRGNALLDSMHDVRGYRCPSCDLGWTPRDLKAFERGPQPVHEVRRR